MFMVESAMFTVAAIVYVIVCKKKYLNLNTGYRGRLQWLSETSEAVVNWFLCGKRIQPQ